MEQKITNNDIRKIITDLGGYVSVTDDDHPVTMIFTKILSHRYTSLDGTTKEMANPLYERQLVEFGVQEVTKLEEFEQTVKEILEYNSKSIFKLHSVTYRGDVYCIRYGHLTPWFDEQTEVTIEEAKELIKTRPPYIHYNWFDDIKTIYKL